MQYCAQVSVSAKSCKWNVCVKLIRSVSRSAKAIEVKANISSNSGGCVNNNSNNDLIIIEMMNNRGEEMRKKKEE